MCCSFNKHEGVQSPATSLHTSNDSIVFSGDPLSPGGPRLNSAWCRAGLPQVPSGKAVRALGDRMTATGRQLKAPRLLPHSSHRRPLTEICPPNAMGFCIKYRYT